MDDQKTHATPRSRILLNFHTKSPSARDKLNQALGLKGKPLKKRTRDDIRVKNVERRGRVEQEAAKSGVAPQHARPGMHGDTGSQVFGSSGLPNVSLREIVSDLLARNFIITGAEPIQEPQVDSKGEFEKTNKQKWVDRVYFTNPDDIDEKTPYKHEPELEQRLHDLLADEEIGFDVVHVWDDNPDGSATVNAVYSGNIQKRSVINVLRFDRDPTKRTRDIIFFRKIATADWSRPSLHAVLDERLAEGNETKES